MRDPDIDLVLVRESTEGLFYARGRGVIFSTHILQEVEASCSRIIIISLGELVADGSLDQLVGELEPGALVARVKGPRDTVLSQMRQLLGEEVPIEVDGDTGAFETYRIHLNGNKEYVEDGLAHLIIKNGWSLASLVRERRTLEDVFHSKTLRAQQEAGHA